MKNKGFTLVELIAVVVMMGMILLIVLPATSRLLKSNEEKKFDTYYDSVEEAIGRYARTRRDELGGIDGEGCVDDKKLSELKEYDYIKEYKEEKNVTCLSPGDFSTDLLSALGVDTSKQYVNIRINNNKGRISVKYSMICVRNYDDPNTMSLLYSNLVEKESTCEAYIPTITNSLINEIDGKYTTTLEDTVNYVTGASYNNYVLYSGNLWQIVSYDTTAKTIKLIANDVVALASYNNKIFETEKVNEYTESNIYHWLQNKFLPTLNNPEKYLLDANWNYTRTMGTIIPTRSVNAKVGLLSYDDFYKSSAFLNIGKNFWLSSGSSMILTESPSKAYAVDSTGAIFDAEVNKVFGVRPAIVLKPNIKFINGGNGTIYNPYKLVGDTSANVGTKLNTRYPGEFVVINNIIFRISSVDSKYTKLATYEPIPIDTNIASSIPNITSADYTSSADLIKFHSYQTLYSDDTFIGAYLRIWGEQFDDILTVGDFCRKPYTSTTSQTAECPREYLFTTKVAIPEIEEMYSLNDYSDKFWTMNSTEDNKVMVVFKDATIGKSNISVPREIIPVIVVRNDLTITGGTGTLDNPYTIE